MADLSGSGGHSAGWLEASWSWTAPRAHRVVGYLGTVGLTRPHDSSPRFKLTWNPEPWASVLASDPFSVCAPHARLSYRFSNGSLPSALPPRFFNEALSSSRASLVDGAK